MRTRTITLKIPRWVPTRHQWLRWKKKVKLFFFPPRCSSCECKLPVEHPVYYKYRTGNHMGYTNVYSDFAVNSFGTKFCAPCLKNYIHQLNLPTGNCDLCDNKNTKVAEYQFNRDKDTDKPTVITFLWHWWNGRKYCLTCVDDLLDNAKVRNAY